MLLIDLLDILPRIHPFEQGIQMVFDHVFPHCEKWLFRVTDSKNAVSENVFGNAMNFHGFCITFWSFCWNFIHLTKEFKGFSYTIFDIAFSELVCGNIDFWRCRKPRSIQSPRQRVFTSLFGHFAGISSIWPRNPKGFLTPFRPPFWVPFRPPFWDPLGRGLGPETLL